MKKHREYSVHKFLFAGFTRIVGREKLTTMSLPLAKEPSDVRFEDRFDSGVRAALASRAEERTSQLAALKQLLRKMGHLSRRGMLRRRARDCAYRLWPRAKDVDAKKAEQSWVQCPQVCLIEVERAEVRLTCLPLRILTHRGIFGVIAAMDLEGRFATCEYCGVPLNFAGRTNVYAGGSGQRHLVDPHVVSIDARVPRCRGGRYIRSSIAGCCWACNTLKAQHSPEILQQRLDSLAAATQVVVDGMLVLPSITPAVITEQDRGTIDRWGAAEMASIEDRMAAQPRKAGYLTKDGLVEIVRAVWAGNGCYRDPCGLVLPLEQGSVDRVGPRGGYSVDNVRLLWTPSNKVRSDCSDARRFIHLETLSAAALMMAATESVIGIGSSGERAGGR